ncbi:thiol:fumarate reductase, subunit A [Methanobrevibacter arboriphilus JCM 13429 = DSM 1125]|uniref:Thiol:fumarate reductase, subunit A n=1 Tax=Methanobrevibacter arboriphilus JCM 13429 = DSM 1125 TaxID=1300164 RepID=A0A1V6N1H1_METAZ|nr:fumarate reductase (CoM/CoB) subunit TfrA [Methanobrevibacter arboriphilus]OQD58531.1 thiol:fumarate reductase, subunit A [Methanobrevibacter arboriphilus JCM 13429 = DSM 1125]
METRIIKSDVLIIGSGGAGCRAAIEISNNGLNPLIISKGLSFRSGCTGMAEGGYNAAFAFVDEEDTKDIHFKDTIKGGSYLNDSKLARILVDEATDRLIDLEEYGALFDRQDSGELNQRPFGGQTFRRTCFQGDRTGHEIMMALKEEIIKKKIPTIDEVMITSLIPDDSKQKVIGAVGLSLKNSEIIFFQSKAVILATGGAGQLYPVTSNTLQKNGDGFALAYNVGADLIDMEEIQFHPTGMLYPDSRKGILVTEAVRGEGGILLNKNNERFMGNYDDRKELATRDVVSRAIYNEIRCGRGNENRGVYLDVTHLDDEVIEEKLETMLFQFLDVGVDIRKQPMEVAPTAHHFMGGIRIDENCKSTVSNLFAAGEAAGGVHGANRLGGNALADTQVFGKRAGISASKAAKSSDFGINNEEIKNEIDRINKLFKKGPILPFEIKKELQNLMWDKVAIIRNEKDLKEALSHIRTLKEKLNDMDVNNETHYNKGLQEALEVINMIEIAELTVKSALIRKESRGAHFREDFPDTKEEWKKSIVMNKNNSVKCVSR